MAREFHPVKVSKALSKALRHDPSYLGLVLQKSGWADFSAVLGGLRAQGWDLSEEQLREAAFSGSKVRFEESEGRIRALQGHSVAVDMQYKPAEPPAVLYHGTSWATLGLIKKSGGTLLPMKRQYVHLSADLETAETVGRRHGKVVILELDAARMHSEGVLFYQAKNGVWLTDAVLEQYYTIRG